uniref:Putative secreted protein n=1 Tax=Anopheles darlingi TaxID=43151 RepID=A0A2M4DK72_ANODA
MMLSVPLDSSSCCCLLLLLLLLATLVAWTWAARHTAETCTRRAEQTVSRSATTWCGVRRTDRTDRAPVSPCVQTTTRV